MRVVGGQFFEGDQPVAGQQGRGAFAEKSGSERVEDGAGATGGQETGLVRRGADEIEGLAGDLHESAFLEAKVRDRGERVAGGAGEGGEVQRAAGEGFGLGAGRFAVVEDAREAQREKTAEQPRHGEDPEGRTGQHMPAARASKRSPSDPRAAQAQHQAGEREHHRGAREDTQRDAPGDVVTAQPGRIDPVRDGSGVVEHPFAVARVAQHLAGAGGDIEFGAVRVAERDAVQRAEGVQRA